MTEDNGNTVKYRVDQLEKNYEKLNESVDLIRTNHLPHIQAKLDSLDTKISVLFAINVGAIILALVIEKIL